MPIPKVIDKQLYVAEFHSAEQDDGEAAAEENNHAK